MSTQKDPADLIPDQLTIVFPDATRATEFHGYMRRWFEGQSYSTATLSTPTKVELRKLYRAEVYVIAKEAQSRGGIIELPAA